MKAQELITKGKFLDQGPSRLYLFGDYGTHFSFNRKTYSEGTTHMKAGAHIVRSRQLVGPDLNMYFILFGAKVNRDFKVAHDYVVEGGSYTGDSVEAYTKFMVEKAGSVEEYLLLPTPPVAEVQEVINESQLININMLYMDYGYNPIVHEIFKIGKSKGHISDLKLLPEAVLAGSKIVRSSKKPKILLGAYKDYKQFLV